MPYKSRYRGKGKRSDEFHLEFGYSEYDDRSSSTKQNYNRDSYRSPLSLREKHPHSNRGYNDRNSNGRNSFRGPRHYRSGSKPHNKPKTGKRVHSPLLFLNDQQKTVLKDVLSSRYDSDTRHLIISTLDLDDKLKQEKIQVQIETLFHMTMVVKFIGENIPSLSSLDVSDNRLYNLGGLQKLVEHTPALKQLNLAKNNISNIKELEKIKGWELKELTLDQNPFCASYKSQSDYVRDITEWFPDLEILDGHSLPAPVKFDVEKAQLPSSVHDFMPSTGHEHIMQFVQHYFKCYDESRSLLSEAYHQDCIFTLAIPSPSRGPLLTEYFSNSRNLKLLKDPKKKLSTVVTSRKKVVSKLLKLESSTHYMNTFSIDVPLLTSSMVSFIVRGLFKEDGPEIVFRAFSRNFVCQILSNCFQITNDQYFIRNPTSHELKEAIKCYEDKPQSSSNQTNMITALANESGMNLKYSEQCLAEQNWNYESARKVFLSLKKQGVIPKEAFDKPQSSSNQTNMITALANESGMDL